MTSKPMRYRVVKDSKDEFCLKGCADGDLMDYAEHAAIAERLRAALKSALDELHYHHGCDPECEKRHADETPEVGKIQHDTNCGAIRGVSLHCDCGAAERYGRAAETTPVRGPYCQWCQERLSKPSPTCPYRRDHAV